MDKTMNTDSQSRARSLSSAFLFAALTLGMAACGDDDGDTGAAAGTGATAGTGAAAGTGSAGSSAGEGGEAGAGAGQCMDNVYEGLGDACKACLCGVDSMIAPSCNENCWIFLACSFKANGGACMGLESGTPEQQDCIMAECGEELAAPGAQLVSGFSEAGLVGACAIQMGDTPAACSPDVGRLISEL